LKRFGGVRAAAIWLVPFSAMAQTAGAIPEGWVPYDIGGITFALPPAFVLLEENKDGAINNVFYGELSEDQQSGTVVILGFDENGFVEDTLKEMLDDTGVPPSELEPFILGNLSLDHYLWAGEIDGIAAQMRIIASPGAISDWNAQLAISVAHRGQDAAHIEAFDPEFLATVGLSKPEAELGIPEPDFYLGGIVEYTALPHPGFGSHGGDSEFYADIEAEGNSWEEKEQFIDLRIDTGEYAVLPLYEGMSGEFYGPPVVTYGEYKGIPAYIGIGTPSHDLKADRIEGPSDFRQQLIALDFCTADGYAVVIEMVSTQSWLDANGGWEALTGPLVLHRPDVTAPCAEDDAFYWDSVAEAAGLKVPEIPNLTAPATQEPVEPVAVEPVQPAETPDEPEPVTEPVVPPVSGSKGGKK
jgi:hypothetical protein